MVKNQVRRDLAVLSSRSELAPGAAAGRRRALLVRAALLGGIASAILFGAAPAGAGGCSSGDCCIVGDFPAVQVNTPYDETLFMCFEHGCPCCYANPWEPDRVECRGTLPPGLTCTGDAYYAGGWVRLQGVPTTPGTYCFQVLAWDGSTECLDGYECVEIKSSGCPPLDIMPPSLPPAILDTPYSEQLALLGGSSAGTFSIVAGALPSGLALSAQGAITGVPSVVGSSAFRVLATDLDGCGAVRDYALVVNRKDCGFTVTPSVLPDAYELSAYSVTLVTSGGTGSYTYALASGGLPIGVSLDPDGTIGGTPLTRGTFPFSVVVWDDEDCGGSVDLTLVVRARAGIVTGPGPGPGNANGLRIFPRDGSFVAVDVLAYGAGAFGTNVASGALDADEVEEALTGPGPGPMFGPQVRGFSRVGAPLLKVNFYAYGTLRYGVNVAGVTVDGDIFDEIVTGPGPGEPFGPHVRGWNVDGGSATPIGTINFHAFSTLKFGATVGGGDLDGDGGGELLAGPGPGPTFGAVVRGFEVDGGIETLFAFAAYPYGHGVRAAAGDVNGDGDAEIATAPGPGPTNPTRFLGFDLEGGGIMPVAGFEVVTAPTLYGGRAALGDLDGDGRADLLSGAGAGPAAPTTVRGHALRWFGLKDLGISFPAFGTMSFGVVVGAGGFGY